MGARWSEQEDKIILQEVENAFNENKSYSEAFGNASKKLFLRTPDQCRRRYYTTLKNPNLNIMNKWSEEEDKILINSISESVSNGKSISDGIRVAVSKLHNRNVKSCQQRWYTQIKQRYVDKVKKIQNNRKNEFIKELSGVDFIKETSIQSDNKSFDKEMVINVLEHVIKSVQEQNEVEVLKARVNELEQFIKENINNYNSLLNSYNELKNQYELVMKIFNEGQKMISK